jgi:hypothetical protein
MIYLHIKRHEGLDKRIMEGYISGMRKRGRPKSRWVPDNIFELQMRVSEAGQLGYDRVVFRRAAKAAKSHRDMLLNEWSSEWLSMESKSRQGQTTE